MCIRDRRGADEPPLAYLLSRLQRCDLVLVEGFKEGDFPKLEVWRAAVGKPTLWPSWPGICGIASDTPAALPAGDVQRLDLADLEGSADFVLAHAAEQAGP